MSNLRTTVPAGRAIPLATAIAGAALGAAHPDEPIRGYWGVKFSQADPLVGVLANCPLYDTLIGVDCPISAVFLGGRGGTKIVLAAGGFFGWPEPVRMTLTVDDGPRRWSYEGVTGK